MIVRISLDSESVSRENEVAYLGVYSGVRASLLWLCVELHETAKRVSMMINAIIVPTEFLPEQ